MEMTYRQLLGTSGGHSDLRAVFSQLPAKIQFPQSNSCKEINSANNLNKLEVRFVSVEPPNKNITPSTYNSSASSSNSVQNLYYRAAIKELLGYVLIWGLN